ncbi:MAG: hypothetical protein H0T69_06750 [Thermoleophilaceae bacterium]|nr:hypothetical protein [Thermoleophilaceae bacterium]
MTTEPRLSPRFERSATPPPGHAEPGAIRPDRLTIWPTEDGCYGIDVRWHGRECMLRAVVVRRLLAEAGLDAQAGNSQDGRLWELRVGPVPADQVAKVIEAYIW